MSLQSVQFGSWASVPYIPNTAKPPCRTYFSLDVVNSVPFLFGGYSQSSSRFADMLTWVPNLGWNKVEYATPRSNRERGPGPVYMHAASGARNRLWVFGGHCDVMTSNIYAFNPANRSWTAYEGDKTKAPGLRHGHCMVTVEENIVVIGGRSDTLQYLSDVYLFDTSIFTWTPLPSLPVPLAYHIAFVYKDEIYVYGGFNQQGCNSQLYVLRNGRWESLLSESEASMPKGRCGIASALHGQFLYTFGGYGEAHTNVFHRFDLDKLEWSELITMDVPEPRAYGRMFVHDNRLYIIGGFNGTNCPSDFRAINLPRVDGAISGVAARTVAIPYMTTPKERAMFILKQYGSRNSTQAQTPEEKVDSEAGTLTLKLADVQALMADLAFRPSLTRALLGIRPPQGTSVTQVDELEEKDEPSELAQEDDGNDDDYDIVYEFNTEALAEMLRCGFDKAHVLQVIYNLHLRRAPTTFEAVMNQILDETFDPSVTVPFKRVHKYGGIKKPAHVKKPAKPSAPASQLANQVENGSSAPQPARSGQSDSTLLRQISSLESQLETLKDMTTCAICYDLPRAYAFDPCGHLLCDVCATAAAKTCPFCRATITHRLKLHM